jgi:hypothetical protein
MQSTAEGRNIDLQTTTAKNNQQPEVDTYHTNYGGVS